jgi:hypothetical protein
LIPEELLSSRPAKHIQVLIRDSKSKTENRRKRKRKENITKKIGRGAYQTEAHQVGPAWQPSGAQPGLYRFMVKEKKNFFFFLACPTRQRRGHIVGRL